MYLSGLSLKQKPIISFTVRFSLSCDIFVYRLEKSEIESDEAIFVLFVLLIPGKTTSSFWTGQKVLTTEK